MSTYNFDGLIGSGFHKMTGLSAFGQIYRISRLNSLITRHAIDVLGIDKNILKSTHHRSLVGLVKVDPISDIKDRHCVGTWPTEDDLIPFQLKGRPINAILLGDTLHGCRTCLKSGFHSLVHQAPWIDKCPWHHELLIDHCRCGEPLMKSLENLDGLMVMCVCGYDYFDRLTALKSLIVWPEAEVKQAIRNEVKKAKRLRNHHHLVTGNELSLDLAVSACRGKAATSPYVLTTDITLPAHDVADSYKAYRSTILCWNEIKEPNYLDSVPLLPSDTEKLHAFSESLLYKLRQFTSRDDLWPFRVIEGQAWLDNAPIDAIETCCSLKFSDQDLEIAHSLIEQFVDTHTQHDAMGRRGKCWRQRLHTATDHISDDMRLLARLLSAHATQCLMECLTNRAWRAYADKEFAIPRCSGHSNVLWKMGEVPSATIVRVLTLPAFNNPTPEQGGNFRRTLGAHIRPNAKDFRTWPRPLFDRNRTAQL